MKIRRDPKDRIKAEVEDILRNHEWLFIQDAVLSYPMLADLVTDLVYAAYDSGKTYTPTNSPAGRILRLVRS